MMLFLVFLALAVLSSLVLFGLHVHGIVLSFKKKWYLGVVSLVIPWFAVIVSAAKLFFKRDILK